MALNIPMPNFTVQQPDIMGAQQKMMQLSALRGSLAMQPLQQQEAQQQIEAGGLANQKARLELQSQQAMVNAWKDPDFVKSFTGTPEASSSGLGFDPNAMTKALVDRGVAPAAAMALSNQFVERSKNMADIYKTQAQGAEAQAGERTKGYKVLGDRIADILDMPAAKAAEAFNLLKTDLVNKSKAFSGVPQDDLAHVYSADLEHLPAMASMIGLDQTIAEHHKAQAEAQKAQQGVIPPGGGMSPETQQGVLKDVAVATNPDVQKGKLDVARAEAAARASVELSIEPLRLQVQQQFGNMKDARDKIESTVLKPFQEKMTDINMARTALSQAQDNPVAARAAVFKMIGVSQPTGSHRVLPAEITAFQYPGGIGTKIQEKWNDFLKGEPWTPEVAQAASAFIDGQEKAAQTGLSSGVDNVNKLYGTSVGTNLKTMQPIFARDPQGKLHQAPAGTPLPPNWKEEKPK